ncbi:MAG: carbohydrate ABC transporter permease [Actinomycetota bacterium]|nr:carbohydrate ABC transporter permease [Actinomycetota bacterium]
MKWLKNVWLDVLALVVVCTIFIVPFAFIFVTAMKSRNEAALLQLTWPTEWHAVENFKEVWNARDQILLRAFRNSLLITVTSVAGLVILASMVGFVLERRNDRLAKVVNAFLLAGLIVPPAVVPTIYVLQEVNLFKTLTGLVLIEIAYLLPFSVLLFRAFVSTIPKELDEAAMIDGTSGLSLFFRVVFPLLRPVVITVIVTGSVIIYNDFQNPLYFLPGNDNTTVQLTLYNFQGQFATQWNLLFMDVLLITIPPLIMFMFFNRKIVAGLTAGAIKA